VTGRREEHETSADTGRAGDDRRWRVVALSLVPMVAIAALLGFGLGRDPTKLPNVLVGHRAPDFALRDLQTGRTLRLSDLRGHPVVLNFWASWCAECYTEHPDLTAAWREYGDRGVVFLGVLYQDSRGAARGFVGAQGQGWPTVVDPGGRTAIDYGVTGVPETVFVSSKGVIVHKEVGPSTYAGLRRSIDRMFRGAPT
jgi:cytochrome c biogenesis protein CcmG, thiol:disulfide interchange protein DsbE